jgi:hypothetical protein
MLSQKADQLLHIIPRYVESLQSSHILKHHFLTSYFNIFFILCLCHATSCLQTKVMYKFIVYRKCTVHPDNIWRRLYIFKVQIVLYRIPNTKIYLSSKNSTVTETDHFLNTTVKYVNKNLILFLLCLLIVITYTYQ